MTAAFSVNGSAATDGAVKENNTPASQATKAIADESAGEGPSLRPTLNSSLLMQRHILLNRHRERNFDIGFAGGDGAGRAFQTRLMLQGHLESAGSS